MDGSLGATILFWLIILGYINWFYTIGAAVYQLIRDPKSKYHLFRFGLTLFIPWVGGIMYWFFPFFFTEKLDDNLSR